MSTVAQYWTEIEDWLKQNASQVAEKLNPGASEEEIKVVEEAIGYKMPQDWRELYSVHNGIEDGFSLFYGMRFLPLERVLDEVENNSPPSYPTTISHAMPVQSADPGVCMDDMLNVNWIALCHDWSETLIRVDMAPTNPEKKGQVIFTDHSWDTVIYLATSIKEFLREYVEDLKAGVYQLNGDALAEGEHFLDCTGDKDLINWSNCSRWRHLIKD